jgi:hypothetical protein
MKQVRFLFVMLALLLMSGTMQAQFGRRVGKAVENAAKRTVERKDEQKTEEAVGKAIDKATDREGEGKEDQKASMFQMSAFLRDRLLSGVPGQRGIHTLPTSASPKAPSPSTTAC